MKKKFIPVRGVCFIFILLFVSLFSYSQNKVPVTGIISDDKSMPVEGVSVQEKGTNNIVVSKKDGSFQISVASSNAVLVLTSVGFAQQEVKVGNNRQLTVGLKPKDNLMEDVVVVGYGTRKKTDVTGAIASISGDKLRSVPTTNVSNSLQGRVAGVEVAASSFRPGAGSRIRIRGNRSLSASNEPLYVVDGIPVSYTIDDINPADVRIN